MPLSRRGHGVVVHRQPLPAAAAVRVAADPFEPYALAAVELAEPSRWWCSARSSPGVDVDDLRVGHGGRARARHAVRGRRARVPRLEVAAGRVGGEHDEHDPTRSPSSAWACTRGASGAATSSSTAWSPRRPRSPTPAWRGRDIQFVAGADTIRNGYPGFVAGATFAQALGWTGARVVELLRRLRLGRAGARHRPARRSSPASATSRSSSAPTPRPRASSRPSAATAPTTPTGCGSGCSAPPTPRTSRSTPAGAWSCTAPPSEDFAQVKVKNAATGSHNPNARYRKEVTEDDVLASPVVADPLRLLDICATTDGGAAIVRRRAWTSPGSHGTPNPVTRRRRSPPSRRRYPQHRHRAARLRHRLRARRGAAPTRRSATRSPHAAYEEAGLGPDDLDLAEVYDLSTALELDWYENIGLCAEGEAERLLHDGDTDHRRAHPGEPERRAGVLRRGRPRPGHRPGVRAHLAAPGPGRRAARSRAPRVGLTVNQGLFGHGSSVIVDRVVRRRPIRAYHRRRGAHAGRPARRRPDRRCIRPTSAPTRSAPSSSARARPAAVDDVFFGCVDTIGPQAGDIARTAGSPPGCPRTCPAPRSTASAARRSRPCTSPPRR